MWPVYLVAVASMVFGAASIVEHLWNEPEPEIWVVTSYCACKKCCGAWATKGVDAQGNRITASGHVIKPGDKFVAAPKNIPFGTLITIPSYSDHPVPVLDRGGAIGKGRLDLYFGDENGVTGHQRALNWGVRYFEVVK